VKKIVKTIELFIEANENLKRVDNMALPLELAVLKLVGERGFVADSDADRTQMEDNDSNGDRENKDGCGQGIPLTPLKKGGTREINSVSAPLCEGGQGDFGNKCQTSNDIRQQADQNREEDTAVNTKVVQREDNLGDSISIDQIKNKWAEVFQAVKSSQPTLACIFTVSKPIEIQGNILKIAHKYSFHSERVNDLKNKQNLENILEKVFNIKLVVENVVSAETRGFDADSDADLCGNADDNVETERMDTNQERIDTDIIDSKDDNLPEATREESSLLQDVLDEVGGEVIG
ncbi:hypothetical protein ACFL23_04190, partial [Patescibacteria group bacterium]